jgi:multidrug transporter EmrE-like cation transporter
MSNIMGVPMRTILLILFVTVTQVAGSALLVKTDGFRAPGWTALCLGIYVTSFFAMVPLLAIGVGLMFFGETASWTRLGLLGLSCILVGVAARS